MNESRQHQADKNDVHILPEELDERVAKFHLPAFGAALIVFTQEHADYADVKVECSFKNLGCATLVMKVVMASTTRLRSRCCLIAGKKCR